MEDRTKTWEALFLRALMTAEKELGEPAARKIWAKTLKSRVGKKKARTAQYNRLFRAMWVVVMQNPDLPVRGGELYKAAIKVFREKTGVMTEQASILREIQRRWPGYERKCRLEHSKALARELMRSPGRPTGLYALGSREETQG